MSLPHSTNAHPYADGDACYHWYVVHTKPHKEKQVAQTLQQCLALPAYLPEVRQRFRHSVQLAPLFPRYLFVLANLCHTAPTTINATQGVHRLVTFDDACPLPIAPAVVAAIAAQVVAFNDQGGLPCYAFQHGDVVHMRNGPLRGLEAVFLRVTKPDERAQILVDFLGSHREANVDITTLERATTPSAPFIPSAPRRTRGKGRKTQWHKDFG